MRIIVMSDSHGDCEAVARVIAENPGAKLFFHLGDGWRDCENAQLPPGAVFFRLRGNCDRCCDAPETVTDECGGVKILAVHGHRQGVKLGLGGLAAEGAEEGAGLVLYGHTHIQKFEKRGGVVLLNPGALGGYVRRYAAVTLENGKITPELLCLV